MWALPSARSLSHRWANGYHWACGGFGGDAPGAFGPFEDEVRLAAHDLLEGSPALSPAEILEAGDLRLPIDDAPHRPF